MGSGRGDRNQLVDVAMTRGELYPLQWGPVVVTGISSKDGPVLIVLDELQWGPVVVTGISWTTSPGTGWVGTRFNGVRSW